MLGSKKKRSKDTLILSAVIGCDEPCFEAEIVFLRGQEAVSLDCLRWWRREVELGSRAGEPCYQWHGRLGEVVVY